MTKIMFRALLSLMLVYTAHAEWKDVGTMTVATPHGNQLRFRNRETTAVITVLAPNLVRVRMVRGKYPDTDYSWAVVKTDWPIVPVQFVKEPSHIIMRTSELEVRIERSPFRIAFYELGGRLISRDARQSAWDGSQVRCWKQMPPDERYYGLGEKTGPLEKNGHSYVMWNTDPSGYDALTDPMYQSIPFFLALRNGKAYGIFFDNSYRSSFDMGAESPDYFSFGADGGELNYYFFWGPSPRAVIQRFTELVGRMELPPLWSLGYIQSNIGYFPENKVRFIAENFRQRHIPSDALFLDNVHMDGNRVFTWDRSGFPNPGQMISDLGTQGFHVIETTDPGIKVEKNYRVYEEGLAGDNFLRRQNGTVYTGIIWPGNAAFPDFTSEKTRGWWGTLSEESIKIGTAGFLADMNEPTIDVLPLEKGWIPHSLDADVVFYDHGLHSPYGKNHNVYGMLMSRAIRDGLLRYRPDERPFVVTRATYAGGQQYAAQWTGDNLATWEDFRASLRIMLSMGLSGLPFTGSDIGGFIGLPSPELYTRWLQAGMFSPFFWTHNNNSVQGLEPWSFGEQWEGINRKTLELRYRLLPYLYNAFYQSTETGIPIMRALLLDYPDDEKAMAPTPDQQNNEFLFGDDLLVAPVVKEGRTERTVYLPKGTWYDFWTDKQYLGPACITANAPIDRIPLFIKGGAIIPTRQNVEYVEQAPINPLTFEIYPEGNSSRSYYEDDGVSFAYRKGVFLLEHISLDQHGDSVRLEISSHEGSYVPPSRSLLFKIHGQAILPTDVTFGNETTKVLPSVAMLGKTSFGAAYDNETRILWISVLDSNSHLIINIR